VIVRELNRAYDRLPFSEEYDGVSDRSPAELQWSAGPNTENAVQIATIVRR
jgi:hypothetical protein